MYEATLALFSVMTSIDHRKIFYLFISYEDKTTPHPPCFTPRVLLSTKAYHFPPEIICITFSLASISHGIILKKFSQILTRNNTEKVKATIINLRIIYGYMLLSNEIIFQIFPITMYTFSFNGNTGEKPRGKTFSKYKSTLFTF